MIGTAACRAAIASAATPLCGPRTSGANARKTCDWPDFFQRIHGRISCVALPPASSAPSTSSTNARPDPFQKPIGNARCDASIAAASVRQMARRIVPTRHRQRLTALAIRRQRPVRKLRHRHIQHDGRWRVLPRSPPESQPPADCSPPPACSRPTAEGWPAYSTSRSPQNPPAPPAIRTLRHAASASCSPAQRRPCHVRAQAPWLAPSPHKPPGSPAPAARPSAQSLQSSSCKPALQQDQCVRAEPSPQSAESARCRAWKCRRDRLSAVRRADNSARSPVMPSSSSARTSVSRSSSKGIRFIDSYYAAQLMRRNDPPL